MASVVSTNYRTTIIVDQSWLLQLMLQSKSLNGYYFFGCMVLCLQNLLLSDHISQKPRPDTVPPPRFIHLPIAYARLPSFYTRPTTQHARGHLPSLRSPSIHDAPRLPRHDIHLHLVASSKARRIGIHMSYSLFSKNYQMRISMRI
jgi:hypothetical protein